MTTPPSMGEPSRSATAQAASGKGTEGQSGKRARASSTEHTDGVVDGPEDQADALAAGQAYAKTAQLATLLIDAPHRFGHDHGDTDLQQKSLEALKAVFDYALGAEEMAIPSMAQALASAIPNDAVVSESRQTRAGGKRKRSDNGRDHANGTEQKVFEPTPLSELTTTGMGTAQIWEQIELRNAKVCRLLDAIIVKDEAQQEDDEERDDDDQDDDDDDEHENVPLDELESAVKRRAHSGGNGNKAEYNSINEDEEEEEEEGEEEDDLARDQIVHSLSSLSDADMRAIGLDPELREQYESGEADEDGLGEGSDGSDEDEDEDGEGYPGASDLSDDDEYHGKIVVEPLQTEEQQMKRKAEIEERERQEMQKRMRLMRQLRRHDPDAQASTDIDDEGDEDDDDEDDTYNDDDAEEADEESDEDGTGNESEEEEVESEVGSEAGEEDQRQTGTQNSILDNLDARGGGRSHGRIPKRHAELDDDFFSIDQFNADTDDYGDEGVDLGDEVDLFKSMEQDEEEEQENPLYYADFFAPPPYKQSNDKSTAAKGSAKNAKVTSSQQEKKSADTPLASSEKIVSPRENAGRRTRVRFDDSVKVRRIKARKPKFDPFTNGLFSLLNQREDEDDEAKAEEEDEESSGASDEESQQSEDEESNDEQSLREDEEDEAEVESSMDVDEADTPADTGSLDGEADSEEEQETVRRVAGDLFANDSDEEDDDSSAAISSHEKRLQALQEEIARLEEENVAKKDWTLMGESSSRSRPENSLLEEDLEFESNAKAKPVNTVETTATLEDMIKKRILENNYDDVQRRATLNPLDFIPSKLLELSDQKSSQSLDQIYEDELGAGGSVDSRGAQLDKELQKEHEEIDGLYDALERQLDALSNAHYTPKAPKVSIQTITNAPAITLEESLPSSMSNAAQLAPEEVYDAGGRHNIALEGASSELTPEEKKRRHRQLRDEKRDRNEKIAAHRKNVEINRQAFPQQNRGGRFGGGAKNMAGSAAQEKDAALRKLMGNKGVSVVGKGNGEAAGKGKGKRQPTNGQQSLNASHLKL